MELKRSKNTLHVRRTGLLKRIAETKGCCITGYAILRNGGTIVSTSLPNGSQAVWMLQSATVCMLKNTF
jgi:hypothetical protein